MKITVEFQFDPTMWDEYEEIHPQLTMEDAILELSQGVSYKIINMVKSGAITFDLIEESVLHHCQITKDQLHLKTRNTDIVDARRLCFYLSKEYNLGSCRIIGKRFGNKDHATAYNGWLKATHYLKNNINFKRNHKSFIESFKNGKDSQTTQT